MKKTILGKIKQNHSIIMIILGIIMLASISNLPAYAMGHGMGSSMRGHWGSGLLDWFQKWQNKDEYTNPTDEKRGQLEDLDRQYIDKSNRLNTQIQRKERELSTLLNSTDPDLEEVRPLHREISDLRTKLTEEQRNYELEAQRLNSGFRSYNGNGWSSYGSSGRGGSNGMGYGGHMGGYGQNQ